MGKGNQFSESDWRTLQQAPLWSFFLVAGADGKVSKKEIDALAEFVTRSAALRGALIRDVVVSVAAENDAVMANLKSDKRQPDAGLRDTAEILKRVPNNEAVMFKYTVVGFGIEVARASRGKTGRKIDASEQMAVGLVASFLDLDPKEANDLAARYEADAGFSNWGAAIRGDGGYI